MSDTNAAAASGTARPVADSVVKATSFLDSIVPAAIAKMAAPETTAPAAAAPAPTGEAPKPTPLGDAIKAMREKREAAQREGQREAQYVQENTRLKQELDALRGSMFEDDPVGYARSKGWDKATQLTYAKALMYDLAPDEADPDFRIKMFEQKQERAKKEEAAKAQKQREEQEREAAHKEVRQYAEAMEAAVMSFEAGSYPESEVWYQDDVEGYLRDMFQTAGRLAAAAQKTGTLADISPQAVAKQLEADLAARAARRDKRRSAPQPSPGNQQTVAQAPAGVEQSTIETTDTKTLSGGGVPLPPAKTEAERIQRAMAVLGGRR